MIRNTNDSINASHQGSTGARSTAQETSAFVPAAKVEQAKIRRKSEIFVQPASCIGPSAKIISHRRVKKRCLKMFADASFIQRSPLTSTYFGEGSRHSHSSLIACQWRWRARRLPSSRRCVPHSLLRAQAWNHHAGLFVSSNSSSC